MQVGPAGEDGQGLVAGIAAHSGPQRHGVLAAADQKVQVRAVGVVHQKRNTVGVADLGKGRDVLHPTEIVRAGDVDAKGGSPLPGKPLQRLFQLPRRHRAAAQRPGSFRRGPEPLDVEIEEGGGVEQRLVGVAGGQQNGPLPRRGRLQRKAEHGPDALG